MGSNQCSSQRDHSIGASLEPVAQTVSERSLHTHKPWEGYRAGLAASAVTATAWTRVAANSHNNHLALVIWPKSEQKHPGPEHCVRESQERNCHRAVSIVTTPGLC